MRMIVLVMLEEAPDGHRNWTRMSEMKKKWVEIKLRKHMIKVL